MIEPGDKIPEEFNVVIEIPMNSYIKYEFDKEAGMPKIDRILYTSMVYPFNYGFIPGTLEEDGDPVDVLVLSYEEFIPGCYVKCRPVGVLEMEDEEGIDYKVVAVPVTKIDPRFAGINDVQDIPEAIKNKIRHFFEHYKELEPGKWVRVKDWKGVEEAKKRIEDARKRYLEK